MTDDVPTHAEVAGLGETIRDLPLTHSTEVAGSDPDRSTVNRKPPLLAEAEIRTRLAAWRGLVSPNMPRYRVQRTIGEGSTSRIYEVFDGSLNRPVALKVLLQGEQAAIERTQRFIAEAVATASFDHPGVPAIFDVDIGVEGSVFYTMKLVEGRTLGSLIHAWKEGSDPAMPFAERVGIMLRVTNAVEAAHAHGLVHRDIKPDNVMLGRFGEVYLVDWGAATRVSEEIRPGRRVGTPLFMSPQAAQGLAPDPADDVYSLGATLFATLLQRPPLDGDNPTRFWKQKVVGEFEPPTAAERRRVPRQLLAIAQCAIAPTPSQRYASAAARSRSLVEWGHHPGLQHDSRGAPAALALSPWSGLLALADGWRGGGGTDRRAVWRTAEGGGDLGQAGGARDLYRR